MSRALLTLTLLALSLALSPGRAGRAEPPRDDRTDRSPLTRLLVGLSTRVWGGSRVDAPLPEARPDVALARIAADESIAVHAPASADPERVVAMFDALARARLMLRALGWGAPLADGGRGGTMAFDLYLVDEPVGARGVSDGLDRTGTLDAAMAHAVVALDVDDVDACVTDAYAQALLLGLDPAEHERVRRGFAAWITYAITGRAGCDDAIDAWQFEPEAGPFDDALLDGAGGALFLELLDARYDGGGRFPRELHQLMRQHTWEGAGLRASPDVWESIEAVSVARDERFHDLLVELSVARGMPATGAPHRVLRAIAARPRMMWTRWPTSLPWHSPASPRGVAAGGAAYAALDLRAVEPGTALEIWLQGEFGVRFVLVAIALDERGRELSRRASPPGGTLHKAFVPFVVPAGAHELLLVGVGLGFERPDEDVPEPVARHLRFVVDRAVTGE
jgi:hypothetical protein